MNDFGQTKKLSLKPVATKDNFSNFNLKDRISIFYVYVNLFLKLDNVRESRFELLVSSNKRIITTKIGIGNAHN